MSETRVFLSTTAMDLHDCRDTVRDAIEKLDGFRFVGMESFGARDTTSAAFCIERLRECEVYVGIIGHRYGDSPPDSDESYTALEYRTAVEAEMPRLVFLAPDDFPVPATCVEGTQRQKRQQAFRRRVRGDRLVASFSDARDLAVRVIAGLANWRVQHLSRAMSPAAGHSSRKIISEVGDLDEVDQGRLAALNAVHSFFDPNGQPMEIDASVAVRSFLANKALIQKWSNEPLTVHEANLVYRYRKELILDDWETSVLWHTLLADPSSLVPGWYWARDKHSASVHELLWQALETQAPDAQVGVIRLMRDAAIELPDDLTRRRALLGSLLEQHEPDVRSAIERMMKEFGRRLDVPMLEQLVAEHLIDVRVINQLKSRIEFEDDPDGAFARFVATFGNRSLGITLPILTNVSISALEGGLSSNSASVRVAIARELRSRNAMSRELARTPISLKRAENKQLSRRDHV